MKAQILVGISVLTFGVANLTIGASAHENHSLRSKMGDAVVFDEYVMFDSFSNKLPKRERNERLTAFASAVKENAGYKGYVISYGRKADLTKMQKVIKMYLEKTNLVSMDRIVFVEGGVRKTGVTNFYLVPPGAPAPKPLSQSSSEATLRY